MGALALLLSCACPFESPWSLPERRAEPVDRRLLGAFVGKDEAAQVRIEILPFSKTHYFVNYREEEAVTRLRAFTVKVDGHPILSVHSIEPSDASQGYLFFAYGFTPEGDLQLSTVDENAIETKPESSRALYRLFKKQITNPAFLEPEILLSRLDR